MLVCNVSLRARRNVSAAIAEAVTARDATTTQGLVFSALIDDPTSVIDIVDALLGEILLEAANATDTVGAAGSVFAAAVDAAATAADVQSASLITAVTSVTTVGVAGPLLAFDPTFSGSSLTVIDVGR